MTDDLKASDKKFKKYEPLKLYHPVIVPAGQDGSFWRTPRALEQSIKGLEFKQVANFKQSPLFVMPPVSKEQINHILTNNLTPRLLDKKTYKEQSVFSNTESFYERTKEFNDTISKITADFGGDFGFLDKNYAYKSVFGDFRFIKMFKHNSMYPKYKAVYDLNFYWNSNQKIPKKDDYMFTRNTPPKLKMSVEQDAFNEKLKNEETDFWDFQVKDSPIPIYHGTLSWQACMIRTFLTFIGSVLRCNEQYLTGPRIDAGNFRHMIDPNSLPVFCMDEFECRHSHLCDDTKKNNRPYYLIDIKSNSIDELKTEYKMEWLLQENHEEANIHQRNQPILELTVRYSADKITSVKMSFLNVRHTITPLEKFATKESIAYSKSIATSALKTYESYLSKLPKTFIDNLPLIDHQRIREIILDAERMDRECDALLNKIRGIRK